MQFSANVGVIQQNSEKQTTLQQKSADIQSYSFETVTMLSIRIQGILTNQNDEILHHTEIVQYHQRYQ